MKKMIKKTSLLLLGILLVAAFGCKKNPTRVGLELQPTEAEMDLYYDDSTVTLNAYTVKRDSMNTTNVQYMVLGSLNDPDFGTTTASFNTNFRLSSLNPTFGAAVTLDSVCLMLRYAGNWGDTAAAITMNIYKLNEALSVKDSSEYDARSEVDYLPTPIGTTTFVQKLHDTVTIGSTKYPPSLCVTLNQEFGQWLLEHESDYATNEDFLKVFHGLHIEAEPTTQIGGNMVYFNPVATETKIALFYSHDTTHASFDFVVNANCTWFNQYNQTYSNPDLMFDENGGQQDSLSALNQLYLQPFIGTRIRLNFNGLDKLRQLPNIALNEVKLVLPNANDYDTLTPPPARLIIYAIDQGKEILVADATSSSYFDGNYNKNENGYQLRLTRYMQQRLINPVMDQDELYLQIIGGAYNANSVVLKGNNDIKVRMYYTEY